MADQEIPVDDHEPYLHDNAPVFEHAGDEIVKGAHNLYRVTETIENPDYHEIPTNEFVLVGQTLCKIYGTESDEMEFTAMYGRTGDDGATTEILNAEDIPMVKRVEMLDRAGVENYYGLTNQHE